MPLTQQRMLALLNEAEAFANDHEMLSKDIRAILSSSASHDGMIEQITRRIARGIRPRVVLVIERERYAMTHARNAWNARKKMLGRELSRVKIERPADYIEPEDKVDQLFDEIERARGDAPKPEYAPPADAPESVNPPKPSFWEHPEPRTPLSEALELARVADEMEARRIRQEQLDKEAMK